MNRATALAVAITIAIVSIMLLLSQCSSMQNRAGQERVEDAQAGAATNSAADAINTSVNASERAAASEDLTRANEKDIRNAQGSDLPVSADAGAAGLRALCKRATYSDSQQCRLFRADPAAVEKAR